MNILYSDTNRRKDLEPQYNLIYTDLNTLLRESDFVSLHVSLNKTTYHLIGGNQLALMKPTSILVNAARGGVVDPTALYEALRDHQIGGAALDVTEPEPISVDDPLLTLPNCLIVPHIASASIPARREMSRIAAQNLIDGLNGNALFACINPEAYKRIAR